MDDYERRFTAAIEELEAAGVSKTNAIPLYLRAARKLNYKVRPPHYVPLWKTFIGSGLWFAIVWGSLAWIFLWQRQGMPVEIAVSLAAFTGVLFAGINVGYFKISRRMNDLSHWNDL